MDRGGRNGKDGMSIMEAARNILRYFKAQLFAYKHKASRSKDSIAHSVKSVNYGESDVFKRTYHLFVFEYPGAVPREHPARYRSHLGGGVSKILRGGGRGGSRLEACMSINALSSIWTQVGSHRPRAGLLSH